jgi:ornithine cyclodeaminase
VHSLATTDALIPLADVLTGRVVLSAGRPVLVKSSGLSWEDVVVAQPITDQIRACADHTKGTC